MFAFAAEYNQFCQNFMISVVDDTGTDTFTEIGTDNEMVVPDIGGAFGDVVVSILT